MTRLDEARADGEEFCVVRSLAHSFLLEDFPEDDWKRDVDPGSERSSVLVNQNNVVGVRAWDEVGLVLPDSNHNRLLLLSLDGHQHLVSCQATGTVE